MERYLMEKFKEILLQEDGITDIQLYANMEMNWVISYKYNDEEHLITIDTL